MNVAIVGIGNRERGDDGVGAALIDRLRADPPQAALAEIRDDLSALVDVLQRADKAVIVDAMKSGGAPGTVLRLDATRGPLNAELAPFASTHTINLADVIELARALGKLPREVIVFGVEAADCSHGRTLSPAVAAALHVLEAAVRRECACTKPH